eukprot:TRINITY_DN3014_c1_g1_i1.p2 TRINITY_DN3014_c1_g1~~TRINITY_DN3014_c1_g1_i1.p2  ORF type:complete len:321 (-),score=16.07 TRINITY_DN3014_c1_g1_i1:239-1201(-)
MLAYTSQSQLQPKHHISNKQSKAQRNRPRQHIQIKSCQSSASNITDSRRRLLLGLNSLGLTLVQSLTQKQFAYGTNNCKKFVEVQQVKNPGVDWVILNKDKQLFYPDWLEGLWEAQAQLVDVKFPLGKKYISRSTPGVTLASIIAALPDVGAGLDSIVEYKIRFYNSQKEGGVVADRIFNIKQLLDNFSKDLVTGVMVEYDPLKNPTRLAVRYNTYRMNKEDESFDPRKAEIFINNRQGFQCNNNEFGSSELYRQVNQAKNQGFISDYLVSNYFQKENEDSIKVSQRVSGFLIPQDPYYFNVGDQAVIIYSYQMQLSRIS